MKTPSRNAGRERSELLQPSRGQLGTAGRRGRKIRAEIEDKIKNLKQP